MREALLTPRPVPNRVLPTIAGALVLVAAAASDAHVALAAALTYALAYTAELGLSLASYYGSPAK